MTTSSCLIKGVRSFGCCYFVWDTFSFKPDLDKASILCENGLAIFNGYS